MSNRKPTVNQPQHYWRALAAANEKIGWEVIPDCPWNVFVQLMTLREQQHPEAAAPTIDYRARVFSEDAWKSEKVLNIQPAAWIPEYAWLYSIARADGTFEAAPRLVWMAAYVGRSDWNVEQVGKLLDELERVGLLRRSKADDGKVWGFWVGSEKYGPSKERIEKARYKKGRSDLFANSDGAAQEQHGAAPRSTALHGLGVGVGLGEGEGKGNGLGSDAAKSSENEQPQEQVKSASSEEQSLPPNTVAPKPEAFTNRIEYAAACHAAGVLPVARAVFKSRVVLPKDEYLHEKSKPATDAAIAEELAAGRRANGYEPCSDGIWRPAIDREAQGYIVKRDDGIWCKS